MASLHNMSGQIAIDSAAAQADIQKITLAKQKLQESLNSLNSLKAAASGMTGTTGSSIVNKSTELERQITALIEKLDATSAYINKTVIRYKEVDRQYAAQIRSRGAFGGGRGAFGGGGNGGGGFR